MLNPPIESLQPIFDQVRQECIELAKETKLWSEETLCGMCAIASVKLFNRLKEHKPLLAINTICNWDHVYVVVYGYIVDITASQLFKDTPILIKPFHDEDRGLYKFNYTVYLTEEALVNALQINGWPDMDLPKLKLHEQSNENN